MADITQEQAEALFQSLADNCYNLVTRDEFDAATDVPEGVRGRVQRILADPKSEAGAGAFVVYDPYDDDDGWLLVGDDKVALAQETFDHRIDEERHIDVGTAP
jgi:hypothetical protein